VKERMRGHGTLYQQKDKSGNPLPTWWLCYYSQQFKKTVRVSSGTTDRKVAEKLLDKKIAEVRTSTDYDPKKDKVKVDKLFDLALEHYKLKKRKSLPDFQSRWKIHLQPFFGGKKANSVTAGMVNKYILQRQEENAANGTINRELAALKKMYNYAAKTKVIKFDSVPSIEMLEEDENGRTGFVEDDQYPKLVDAFSKVGLWARAVFETGYTFGFRHSELLGLRVRTINLKKRTITLPPRTTKNKQVRVVVMTDKVYQLVKPLTEGKQPDDFLFSRANGKAVREFRAIWERCCIEAGCGRRVCTTCSDAVHGECKIHGTEKLRWTDKPTKDNPGFTRKVCLSCCPTVRGKHCPKCKNSTRLAYDGLAVHDLRRTAAINLIMADVPKHWAKQVTGHQEDKMFDRYEKLAIKQMEQATQRLETYHKAQISSYLVHNGESEGLTEDTGNTVTN
jgi:integrase